MPKRRKRMSASHGTLEQDPEAQQNGLNTQTENGHNKMGFLHKLAINASLWGIEACCNFEQLYTVPILQSLGLPLRLVSLTGAISGPTGAILLPLLGWLTDLGSTPHTRKIKAAIFGSGVMFCGIACVITANVLHLNFLLQFAANRTADDDPGNFSVPHGLAYSSWFNERGGGGTSWGHTMNTSEWGTGPGVGSLTSHPETEASDSEIPFKAILALVGFIVLDFGYDSCNAFVKSLVVSCGPRAEHTSLLVIGLIMASSGGVFTASVGLIDVSSLLGLSHIKGGRLSLQTTVQGSVTLVFVAMGLLISLLTIRRLLSKRLTALEGTTRTRKPRHSRPHAIRPLKKHQLNNHQEQFASNPMLDAFENSIRSFGGGAVHFDPNLALLETGHTPTTEHAPLLGVDKVPKEDDEDTERSLPVYVPASNRLKDSLPSIPEHNIMEIRGHSPKSLPNHLATEDNYSHHHHSQQSTPTEHTPLLGVVEAVQEDAEYMDLEDTEGTEDAEEIVQSPPTSVSVSHRWNKSLPSIPEHMEIREHSPTSLPNHLAIEESQHSHSHYYDSHQSTPTEHTPLLGAEEVITEDASDFEDTEDMERSSAASLSVSVSYRRKDFLPRKSEHMKAEKPTLKAEARSSCCERSFKVKIFLITLSTYFSTSDLFLFSMTSSDFVGKAIYGGDPAAQPGSQSLTLYQEGVRTASVGFVVYYSSFLFFSFLQSRILAHIGCRVEFTLAHLLMSATLMALSLTAKLEVYFLLSVVAGFHRTCIFSIPFSVANDLIQTRISKRGQGKSGLGLAFSMLSASMPLSYCTLYSWIGPVEEFTGLVEVPFWLGSLTSMLSALTFLAVGKV